MTQKLARTISNLRDTGKYRRAIKRLRRRRELIGLRPYEDRPKANICVPVSVRRKFRPGSGIMWPSWRLYQWLARLELDIEFSDGIRVKIEGKAK